MLTIQVLRASAADRGDTPHVPDLKSRFLGCLLGGALGDALGYPVEFLHEPPDIQRIVGRTAPARIPRRPGHPPPVSDDTQMTLFTAEGLIRGRRLAGPGTVSLDALLHAYQRWLSTQTRENLGAPADPARRGWLLDVPDLHSARAPGNTCLRALMSSLDGDPLPTIAAPPNDSKGCGAVMRSAPFGLVAGTPEAAFTWARDAAVLTHGHPSGYLSAGYFAAVVHGLARDVALPEAMRTADDRLARERGASETIAAVQVARRLACDGLPSPERIERLGGGWVGEEALGIALLCALTLEDGTPDDIRDMLWRSVAHAGDSDSTGSLTGNLLGAMLGVEALPAAWLDDVELRETLEQMALDLHGVFVLGVEPDGSRYPPT